MDCPIFRLAMDFLEDLEVKELKRKQGTIPETKDNTQKIIELRRKRDSLKMQLQAVDKMVKKKLLNFDLIQLNLVHCMLHKSC